MHAESLVAAIRSTLPAPGSRVLIGVSGGVDSVVLLHLLAGLASECGLELAVAHLDHQIREKSHLDAEFVAGLCSSLGVCCFCHAVDVPAHARGAGVSLEMAGRDQRRSFFAALSAEHGFERIALAHHQQDQVETLLLRLVRGTGVAGLAAMRELDGCWWRPLLGVSRQQIEAYAHKQGVTWCEDDTNGDTSYQRNLIRHEVLPRLLSMNPGFAGRIETLVGQVQTDEDFFSALVVRTFAEVLLSDDDGLELDRQELLRLHPAVRGRVCRHALGLVRGGLQGVEAVHLQQLDQLLQGERSQAQLDLPGLWVARRYDRIWLRRHMPERRVCAELPLSVPGQLVWSGQWWLKASFGEKSLGESSCAVEFDWAKLDGQLKVRSWRYGDRFQPLGMSGHKRLKRLFGDLKIPLEERCQLPLVTCAGEILWVAGLRRSTHAPVTDQSQKIIRLELCRMP